MRKRKAVKAEQQRAERICGKPEGRRSVRAAAAGAVAGMQQTGVKVKKLRRRMHHMKKVIDLIGRLL